jgi:hypothetical protein
MRVRAPQIVLFVAVLGAGFIAGCGAVDEAVDSAGAAAACEVIDGVVSDLAQDLPIDAGRIDQLRRDALALAEVLDRLPGVDLPVEVVDQARTAAADLEEAAAIVGVDPDAAQAQVERAVSSISDVVTTAAGDLSC